MEIAGFFEYSGYNDVLLGQTGERMVLLKQTQVKGCFVEADM